MGKFKIGDKVIVTAHNKELSCPLVGNDVQELYNSVGIICDLDSYKWTDGKVAHGIEFEKNINGHDCYGNCKFGYGQHINEKYLKLYNERKSEDKTMQKKKYEKKPLEQQIKERYESKRNVLNAKIGFTKENTLVPKKFYYDSTAFTTVIDFGNPVGKIKAKLTAGDKYDTDVAFNVLTAKAIYKRFDIPFEADMSSLESKIFAKIILHKNTGIMFEKYAKYLKDMEKTFLQETVQMKEVEKIRKNQKAKNKSKR